MKIIRTLKTGHRHYGWVEEVVWDEPSESEKRYVRAEMRNRLTSTSGKVGIESIFSEIQLGNIQKRSMKECLEDLAYILWLKRRSGRITIKKGN